MDLQTGPVRQAYYARRSDVSADDLLLDVALLQSMVIAAVRPFRRACAALAVVILLTPVLPSSLHGHEGDRLLLIPEVTDADLLELDLHDGRIDEWPRLLGEPVVTDADFIRYYGAGTEPSLHFRVWLAWHGASSRIFVAVQTADDAYRNLYVSTGRLFPANDTHVGIGVDGDHSGDDEYFHIYGMDQRGAQEYDVIGVSGGHPPVGFSLCCAFDSPFAGHPPYSDVGGSSTGEQPTITVTEAYVTAFDEMELTSASESHTSRLHAGATIGLALKITDTDVAYDVDLPDVYFLPDRWGHSYIEITGPEGRGGAGGRFDSSSSLFADAVLLPAARREASTDTASVRAWARVKASFSPTGSGRR